MLELFLRIIWNTINGEFLAEIYFNCSLITDGIEIDALFALSATVIALLIPLAIFMMENNGNSKDSSFFWDKMVIFNNVINMKQTIVGLSLITIPLVFWNFTFLRPIALVLYIIGQYFVVQLLINCYKWIIAKGNGMYNYRNQKRFEYLENISTIEDCIYTWKIIWDTEEERKGMDEKKLLETYIVNYENNKNSDAINQLLMLYVPNVKVEIYTQKVLSDFIYQELDKMYEEEISESNLFLNFSRKDLFNEYSSQSIKNKNSTLFYYFKEGLGKFIKEKSDVVVSKFIEENGLKLIENIQANIENIYKLNEILPQELNYDKQEGNSHKQKAIANLFESWLNTSGNFVLNDNDIEKWERSKFTNELLTFLFDNMSPITFSRLREFSKNFIPIKDIKDKYLENMMKEFALRKNPIIQMSRVHTFSGGDENDAEESFSQKEKEETEWTYEYFANSDNRQYQIVRDDKQIELYIELIKKIKEEYGNKDEFPFVKLEGLEYELSNLLKYIRSKKDKAEN